MVIDKSPGARRAVLWVPHAMNERVTAGGWAGTGRAGCDECLCSLRTPGPVARDSVCIAAGEGRADRAGREMRHASFNLMGALPTMKRPMGRQADFPAMTGGLECLAPDGGHGNRQIITEALLEAAVAPSPR
jgi:hypothetical protein